MTAAPALQPDLLYVVLFGPDYGESIVLRIPEEAPGGDSWVVIDSLERDDGQGIWRPPLELLGPRERWSAVILTHPHADHAAGMNAVLNHPGSGPIGCTDLYVEPPEAWMRTDDAETALRLGAVEHALATIQDRWERDADSEWRLRAGSVKTISGARFEVLFPDEATVEKCRAKRPKDPNRLASPVLLRWHELEILLGSDLTAVDWKRLAKLPALAHLKFAIAAHLYKVAHHGSDNAIAPDAVGFRSGALWMVTPFCRGRGLPNYADGHGVQYLLASAKELHVTRCPALRRDARTGQSVPLRLTRQQVRERIAREKIAKGLVVELHASTDVRGAWIAAGFGRDGHLADIQHGSTAIVVTEGAAQRAPPPRKSGKKRGSERRKRPSQR